MLLDLFYPRECWLCQKALNHTTYLCFQCWHELPIIRHSICVTCGETSALCNNKCRLAHIQEVRTVGYYQQGLKQLLQEFKFGRAVALRYLFAALCCSHLRRIPFATPPTAVIAVPLSWQRLLSRGYNQAQLLAQQIASDLGIACLSHELYKTRHVPAQAKLSFDKRASNVKGAFQARAGRIQGQDLLLIDDILTTGSTVAECARVLVQQGAHSVCVLTVARRSSQL